MCCPQGTKVQEGLVKRSGLQGGWEMDSATPVSIRQDEECVSTRARPSGRPEASESGVEAAMLMLETQQRCNLELHNLYITNVNTARNPQIEDKRDKPKGEE